MRRLLALLVVGCVLVVAACSLNPQPLPPATEDGVGDAGGGDASGGGTTGSDAAASDAGKPRDDAGPMPPPGDAATDGSDAGHTGDAGDGGDAGTDAAHDASDAATD